MSVNSGLMRLYISLLKYNGKVVKHYNEFNRHEITVRYMFRSNLPNPRNAIYTYVYLTSKQEIKKK